MKLRRSSFAAGILTAILFTCALTLGAGLTMTTGCAAHRPATAGPVTPMEQANSDNAQIAIHNRAVAKGLVAVYQAGFVEKEYFDKLSAAQIRITRLHNELTPLLKDFPTASTSSAKVKIILDEMTALAVQMVADGSAGIKNPQSQTQIISEVQAVRSLIDSARLLLQNAGVKGL